MMKNILSITVSILILSASISYAAEDNNVINKTKKKLRQKNSVSNPCESTSGLGQFECAQSKMEIADKKLNATYNVLLSKLKEGDWPNGVEPKKDLTGAQRLWIKYREANCQFVGGISGGAPEWQSAYYENCRVEMTEERTKELQKYVEERK